MLGGCFCGLPYRQAPTVLYKTEMLERHGWNEDAKLEDYELYLRLSAEGEFAFDPQVLAAWRQHNGNTSRDLSLMMHQSEASQRRVVGLCLGLCPAGSWRQVSG